MFDQRINVANDNRKENHAKRDVVDNSVNIYISDALGNDDIQKILNNVLQNNEVTKYQRELEILKKELSVKDNALLQFFKILGYEPVPTEELKEKLQAIAERYNQAKTYLLALAHEKKYQDKAIKNLYDQALIEFTNGNYTKARELIGDIEDSYFNMLPNELLFLAKVNFEERNYKEAAIQYGVLASKYEISNRKFYIGCLLHKADCLELDARYNANNCALENALEVYSEILKELDDVPDIELLDVNWKYGNVYNLLGKRSGQTKYYYEAIKVFEHVLKVCSPTVEPRYCMLISLSIGNTYQHLGESLNIKDTQNSYFSKSIKYFETASKLCKQYKDKRNYAASENNRATVLLKSGLFNKDITLIDEALIIYSNQEPISDEWDEGTHYNNISCALRSKAKILADSQEPYDAIVEILEEAKQFTMKASQVWKPKKFKIDYAKSQRNLSGIEYVLSKYSNRLDCLQRAKIANDDALSYLNKNDAVEDWLVATHLRVLMLKEIDSINNTNKYVDKIKNAESALSSFKLQHKIPNLEFVGL